MSSVFHSVFFFKLYIIHHTPWFLTIFIYTDLSWRKKLLTTQNLITLCCMLSCPRDFVLMFQTFPECSSSTMFVIQKHSGSVRLKGRNVTTPDLSEETWPLPSYSQFTSLTVKYCWFRNLLNLLKSFCPCCYLTWLSKPFSHEINELKNTAEALACVKKVHA